MANEKLLIDLWSVNMNEVDTSDCTDVEDILSAVITYLSELPTVDAVPVKQLGNFGKLLHDYKGCPRGQIGRACGVTMEEELTAMDPIVDADGGKWIPVYADALYDFIEKFKKMVELPDCKKCFWNDQFAWHQCENCLGQARNNFLSKEDVRHG